MAIQSSGSALGSRRPSVMAWVALVVAAISVIRILASYHELSQTIDEPYHLAIGMRILNHGIDTAGTLNQPIPKLAAALLPFLSGLRPLPLPGSDPWVEGIALLHERGAYWRNLTLARLGMLPFYLLCVFLLWSWSKRLYGERVALLSVSFFSLIPPVLAYSGLVGTDIPVAAAFLASCYSFWWWLQRPTWQRSLVVGVVLGLSIATKETLVLCFPASAIVLMLLYVASNRNAKSFGTALFDMFSGKVMLWSTLIALSTALTIWAVCGFSIGPVAIVDSLNHTVSRTGTSYPAPAFLGGIVSVLQQSKEGHAYYFLGEPMNGHGSMWFFPVALALRTPIVLLVLMAITVALVLIRLVRPQIDEMPRRQAFLPVLICAAILVSFLPNSFDEGIRHIVLIYPFIALAAAVGAEYLLSSYGNWGRVGLALLSVWLVISSFSVGADRLAYYNEFASASGAHPPFLDFDWGQDAGKLLDTLHARGVDRLDVKYSNADLSMLGFPPFEYLRPFAMPTSEWVAVGRGWLYQSESYAWLRSARPVAMVGNSVFLYHQTKDEFARLLSPRLDAAEKAAVAEPSAERFVSVSLEEYKIGRYEECIGAARKALVFRPEDAAAFTNLSAGYMKLGQWDSAIANGDLALTIDPTIQAAQKNVAYARSMKNGSQASKGRKREAGGSEVTPGEFLARSLANYNAGRYQDCIDAANRALALRPNYPGAYINLCAAYNKLGRYADGKQAGETAVRLDPTNQTAANNLNLSIRELAKARK